MTDGLETSVIDHGGWSEHCLVVRDEAAMEAVAAHHSAAGAAIVAQDVFRSGPPTAAFRVGDVPPTWPVTRLRGTDGGADLGGTQLYAVAGVAPDPVMVDGRHLGAVWEDDHARWCRLGDLRCADPSLPREAQAREVFLLAERALAAAGMGFRQVVRTWFFLDRILEWYDAFNEVRRTFFREQGVYDAVVPASTGIGTANAAGTHLVAGALAVLPKGDAMTVVPVRSPLQCPAQDYGSSFSRAVEILGPTTRRVLVSGTASIDPDGDTVHVGDATAQVDLTMRVVAAILASRELDWNDVTRSVAYFKHAADAPLLHDWCRGHDVANLKLVGTTADVCREDLLFEIEVDAAG